MSARGIERPPTLAVEVLSPRTLSICRGIKLQLHARHGVPHYWIVDPAGRAIDAYVLDQAAYRLAARLVGDERGALPPFLDLTIEAASLQWSWTP